MSFESIGHRHVIDLMLRIVSPFSFLIDYAAGLQTGTQGEREREILILSRMSFLHECYPSHGGEELSFNN